MTRMAKRWIERSGSTSSVETLTAELNLSPMVARVLANRGHDSIKSADSFLNDRLNSLPDPDLLPDMEIAITRLADALARNEPIAIHGDYDVDGITGTSLLVEGLRSFGGQVQFHIPLRKTEGYGLSGEALNRVAQEGGRLVVSVDCGVSAHAEADLAAELGLDLIITDHHQPPNELPQCLALVNPHLEGSRFPWPDLAGVGVAFFLLLALRRRLRENGWFEKRTEPDLKAQLDLVALGTIADMVPLKGVNRVLVHYGLRQLDQGGRPGIDALKQVAEVKKVSCGSVGFRLAPRLNAAGRLEDARMGVQLLLGEGDSTPIELANHLDRCNRERQQIEAETLREAIAQVEELDALPDSLVLAQEGWHQGVIGIVASRLVERYYRPTVLIALSNGAGKGSARSIHGFHLFNALSQSAGHLTGYGGHAAAAGLSLSAEDVASFRSDFERIAHKELRDEDLVPRIEHDGEVRLSDMRMDVLRELSGLSPFGIGNPQPSFVSYGLEVFSPQVVAEKHLRFRVQQAGYDVGCIAFGMAERLEELYGAVDLLFRPEINQFRGQESVQLQVIDIRQAAAN